MVELPTISLIIPTISRPLLARALASVRRQEWQAGDEVILVGDGLQPIARELWNQFGLPGRFIEVAGSAKDWGHTPRNIVHPIATGTHLMALDDDDQLTPNAVAIVRRAITKEPNRPHIFRMDGTPNVGKVWKEPILREANVGTPMMVTPNVASKLGRYVSRYGGDFDFIRDTCGHYPEGPVWNEEVICIVRPYVRF